MLHVPPFPPLDLVGAGLTVQLLTPQQTIQTQRALAQGPTPTPKPSTCLHVTHFKAVGGDEVRSEEKHPLLYTIEYQVQEMGTGNWTTWAWYDAPFGSLGNVGSAKIHDDCGDTSSPPRAHIWEYRSPKIDDTVYNNGRWSVTTGWLDPNPPGNFYEWQAKYCASSTTVNSFDPDFLSSSVALDNHPEPADGDCNSMTTATISVPYYEP
jgi:hypothetical protein